jgi:hypothetical protein
MRSNGREDWFTGSVRTIHYFTRTRGSIKKRNILYKAFVKRSGNLSKEFYLLTLTFDIESN